MSPIQTKYFAFLWRLNPNAPGPSYIPARAFSAALLSVIQNGQSTVGKVANSLQTILNAAIDPHSSAAELRNSVLLLASGLEIFTPPSQLEILIHAHLQAFAGQI